MYNKTIRPKLASISHLSYLSQTNEDGYLKNMNLENATIAGGLKGMVVTTKSGRKYKIRVSQNLMSHLAAEGTVLSITTMFDGNQITNKVDLAQYAKGYLRLCSGGLAANVGMGSTNYKSTKLFMLALIQLCWKSAHETRTALMLYRNPDESINHFAFCRLSE